MHEMEEESKAHVMLSENTTARRKCDAVSLDECRIRYLVLETWT